MHPFRASVETDALGNLLTVTNDQGGALQRISTFSYEPSFSQLSQIVDPDGKITAIAHDAFGNPVSITDPLNNTITATFDPRGLPLTRTDQLNQTTTFTYDANGNVETITDAVGTVTRLTRDAAGNVTAVTEAEGTALERLSSFTYDANGRLLTATDPTGAPTTFTYDAAGNVTSVQSPTGETTAYTYDTKNRIATIDDPARGLTTLATYAYDALGRRIAKDVDDGASGREVTAYVYDGPDILMEFDGTGSFLARYAHGDRVDQPLAMTRGGQDYYVHADHQGSVMRVFKAISRRPECTPV